MAPPLPLRSAFCLPLAGPLKQWTGWGQRAPRFQAEVRAGLGAARVVVREGGGQEGGGNRSSPPALPQRLRDKRGGRACLALARGSRRLLPGGCSWRPVPAALHLCRRRLFCFDSHGGAWKTRSALDSPG